MRTIGGYVCVATIQDTLERRILFGQDVHNNQNGYENIETNGLKPYQSIACARRGKCALAERPDFKSVRIARLALRYAENKGELQQFRGRRSLVAIATARADGARYLCGPWREGLPQVIPFPGACSRLSDNGFATFRQYADAEQVAREIRRQGGGMPSTIGTFSLKYV